MSFGWTFYEIPNESYAILKISDSLLKNPSNHLIRHWTGDTPRKNCEILCYTTNIPLSIEPLSIKVAIPIWKLCNFKD